MADNDWGDLDGVLEKLPPLSPKQRRDIAKLAEKPLVDPVPLKEGEHE